MRPLSYYATPGARAFGSLGIVPDDVDAYGGLTMAECALMPNGRILEPSTFTQAQYKNNKWGDETEVAVFLVLAILYLEEKPDIVVIYGIWCNDKDGDNSNFIASSTTARGSCATRSRATPWSPCPRTSSFSTPTRRTP